MTELKSLGKKPPEVCLDSNCPMDYCFCEGDHYISTLLETADELEKRCPKRYRKAHTEEDEKICCWCGLAKKLRISAGEE